jgi:proteasome accessory factor C
VLSLCGGDERDPNQLVGVLVEDDVAEVFADLPALERPVRLTAVEARALLSALGTLGVDPGSTLIGKLSRYAATGVDLEQVATTVRTAFAQGGHARVIAALDMAAENHVTVRIEYASWGSGEVSERTVRPYALYRWRDSWYLLAFCERTQEERTFRVDRITSATMTRQPFERPASLAAVANPLPDLDELPRATVRFASAAPDLTDREWPGATFDHAVDGSVTASIPYAGTSWISRRIAARIGAAEVLEPAEVREAVARTARDVLSEMEQ